MVAERTPVREAGTTGAPRVPGVSRVLVVGLFVTALLGRFTLDRLGSGRFGDLDLRIVAFGSLVLVTLMWRFLVPRPGPCRPWPLAVRLNLVFFGYLAATVFWAPPGARVAFSMADLGYLMLLVVLAVTLSAPDPARARRHLLACMFTAGAVYAVAGLLFGQVDQQGRAAAFGGGPNVYVRVIVFGIIGAVALAVLYRRALFLLAVPVLAAAAVQSGSRGGVLAALATALFVLVLCARRMSWRGLAATGATVAAVLVGGAYLLDARARAAGQARFVSGIFERDQFSDRPELLAQGLRIAVAHPVLGGGLDSFYAWTGQVEDIGYPHNLVVNVADIGGAVGVVLLAAVLVAYAAAARPWLRLPADQLALVAAACYVAIASMFSGDLYDSRFLWIFLVLVASGRVSTGPGRRPDG
jgi:O-antigen ligase